MCLVHLDAVAKKVGLLMFLLESARDGKRQQIEEIRRGSTEQQNVTRTLPTDRELFTARSIHVECWAL